MVDSSLVGLIGVGVMGRGFLRNLRASGHEVVCYDTSDQAMAAIEGKGILRATSPAEVTDRSDVILTMLPGKDEVEEVVHGEAGILIAATKGKVLVELSTIEPAVIARVMSAARPGELAVLDGGVSGSPKANWHGQSTFLIGGDTSVLQQVRPILEPLCSQLIHTGELGSAKVAKLINNLIAGVSMAAVAEAFQTGMLHGVSPTALYGGMMASWARCAVLERMPPIPELRPDEETDDRFPDFHIAYMAKDLMSTINTAVAVGASHVMATAAYEIFDTASRDGRGLEPIWRVVEPPK